MSTTNLKFESVFIDEAYCIYKQKFRIVIQYVSCPNIGKVKYFTIKVTDNLTDEKQRNGPFF